MPYCLLSTYTFVQALLPATILKTCLSPPGSLTCPSQSASLKGCLLWKSSPTIKSFSHLASYVTFNRILYELPCQPFPVVCKINKTDDVLFIAVFPKAQHNSQELLSSTLCPFPSPLSNNCSPKSLYLGQLDSFFLSKQTVHSKLDQLKDSKLNADLWTLPNRAVLHLTQW